jgi:hypothetical protein
LRMRIRRL